jgi:hypothetical protein
MGIGDLENCFQCGRNIRKDSSWDNKGSHVRIHAKHKIEKVASETATHNIKSDFNVAQVPRLDDIAGNTNCDMLSDIQCVFNNASGKYILSKSMFLKGFGNIREGNGHLFKVAFGNNLMSMKYTPFSEEQ